MAHRHTHTSIMLYRKIKKEKPTHTQVTIKHIPIISVQEVHSDSGVD